MLSKCHTGSSQPARRSRAGAPRPCGAIAVGAVGWVLAGVALAAPETPDLGVAFAEITSGELRRDLTTLASDELGGRGAGYAGEYRAALYSQAAFEAIGLRPLGDEVGGNRGFLQAFELYPEHPTAPGSRLVSHNVLGLLPGTDPRLAREVIVVGAHHDGQGQIGEADPGRITPATNAPTDTDTIWNSADDNASGMVTVLAIARALHRSGLKPCRSILFATFGAEEHGLVGSLYYVSHPALPWHRQVAMLTFEQMGREPQSDLIAMGTGTSPDWTRLLTWANGLTGRHVRVLTPQLIQDTDHYGFGVRGVPAMSMGIEVSPDAHRASDSADKIDFEKLAERARYALAIVVKLANAPRRPAFAGVPPCLPSSLDPNLGDRCSPAHDPGLGVVGITGEESAAALLPKGAAALKVVATVASLPADRAGLKPGDLIVAIDGEALAAGVSPRRVHVALERAPNSSIRVRIQRDHTYRDILLRAHEHPWLGD